MKLRRMGIGERLRDGDGYLNVYGTFIKTVRVGQQIDALDVKIMEYRRPIRRKRVRTATNKRVSATRKRAASAR